MANLALSVWGYMSQRVVRTFPVYAQNGCIMEPVQLLALWGPSYSRELAPAASTEVCGEETVVARGRRYIKNRIPKCTTKIA